MKRILLILFLLFNLMFANQIFDNQREFNLRKSETAIKGDMNVTGASIMCVNDGSGNCNWNYNGYLYDASGLFLHDDPSITKNSSGAYLTIPNDNNVTIVWAGLYWQGHKWNKESGLTNSDFDTFKQNIDKVVFETPDGVKHNIIADQTDYYGFIDNDGERIFYSCFKNVTDLVKNYQGRQYFVVGNMDVSDGYDQWIGDPLTDWSQTIYGPWGGWSLVVIYQYPNTKEYSDIPYKNIAIYDGFRKLIPELYEGSEKYIEISNLSGFLTPKYGDVNANMLFFAAGGEKKMHFDSLQLKDKDGVYRDVNNSLNPIDDQFNGSITVSNEEINTTKIYNPGIDIDLFNVGKDGISNEIIGNSQTSTAMKLCAKANSSQGDQSFPSVIAFSTQLYTPRVCYDNLTYYDENGNEITSGSQVSVGSKIRAEVEIKNLDNEIAKDLNVSLYFDDNITAYVENSTKIKDVNTSTFSSIDDNQSIGSLGVIYDDITKLWKVGIIGDNNNEFLPTNQNSAYVAKIDFNFTIEGEGNVTFDFIEDYIFEYDNKIIPVHRSMPACSELNATLNSYNPAMGSFNVVEENFSGNTDPVDANDTLNQIYTKIVNKNFNMKVIKLKDDNTTLENYKGLVRVDIINEPSNENECQNNTAIIKKYVTFNNIDSVDFNIISDKSLQSARFRVKYLKNKSSEGPIEWNCVTNTKSCLWGMLTAKVYDNSICNASNGYPEDNCPCATECNPNNSQTDDDCFECVFGGSLAGSVCSRDNFAIRPAKYKVSNTNQKLIAGQDINITVQAIDYNGALISDFNFTNAPVELNITDALGCKTGTLNKPLSLQTTLNFSNGAANLTLNYSEVGDLNISVKEYKNGNEYAHVDANDSVDSSGNVETSEILLIGEGNSTLSRFYPDHFAISGSYNNHAGGTFTYISSDLNMSAVLNLRITAESKNSNKTENYNKNCYAKNFDLNVSYDDLNASEVPIIFYEINSTEYNTTTNNDLNFTNLSKDFFDTDNNGTANILIKINFDKNYTNPIEEFNMTVRDVNVSDVNGTFGSNDIHDTATFRYGRIKVSNAASYSSDINTTFEYQYWTNDGWVKNTDHINANFGDFNHTLNASVNPYVTITNSPSVNNGEQKVVFHTTHSLPYSAKVHLAVDSWLWYHPLAKDYKAPESNNTDCLTHPCLKLDFLKSGSAWGGVGAVSNAKFSEENRTSEINASSHTDVNVSKSQVKKINW